MPLLPTFCNLCPILWIGEILILEILIMLNNNNYCYSLDFSIKIKWLFWLFLKQLKPYEYRNHLELKAVYKLV